MMNESAVMPTATMKPAMPGRVMANPMLVPSRITISYVINAATASDAITTSPRPR